MNNADLDRITSATAYDADGDKVGRVGQVYLDDETGRPTWVSVSTGLFGTSESLAPLEGHRWDGDRLVLAHAASVIKDAPRVDVDQHISPEEENELFGYYRGHGYDYASTPTHVQGDRDVQRAEAAADVRERDLADRDARDDRARVEDGTSMTASEERLNVDKETTEAGRVRLRKYTTTEEETVTVPVTKEKVVVERTPVDGRRSEGTIEDRDGEQVEEITLREERAVVSKETVDVEEVSLGKETVTEEETVSGQVRKEHIEVEGDDVTDRRR